LLIDSMVRMATFQSTHLVTGLLVHTIFDLMFRLCQ
jgi:hypothetical protein